ncbi:pentapeptide repeat-containing protein [Dactylosporangium sp. CA-052675]|uniref:pentapeptide repeat-containing protein n=1 Tax=Dactylosporangium sp. CA-052675 TaxID=3239927 RepID=UPI003D8E77AB
MRRPVLVVLIVLLSAAGLASVLLLPPFVVDHDLGRTSVGANERLTAINNARTVLLQALGAVILALGAYATWHRLRINEEELRLSRSAQTTERYSRAVEHLGHDSLDVRIGGVYALEQIAGQSPPDRGAIIAILRAYVRGHSPWPPGLPGQPPAGTPPAELPTLAMRANDVQAAVDVLVRLHGSGGAERLSLPRCDLRYARMNGAVLPGANLGNCGLTRARLRKADLRDCLLGDADLRQAELDGADLRGADLGGADLRGTDLRGTDLRGADLATVRLDGAVADADTRWPDGFDPVFAGVVTPARDGA